MKYFKHFSGWAFLLGVSISCTAAGILQCDPTDDLSLTLARASERRAYDLVSEKQVEAILADRLDLFPRSEVPKLSQHLLALCHQFSFDPAFILSLIQEESGFRVRARSKMGAVGLMQIMPATAEKIAASLELGFAVRGTPMQSALFDPFVNLTVGIAYLAWLRDKYVGRSPYYLVAAFNIGPAKVDELLSRKSFEPVKTKKYYEDIRKNLPEFRFYDRQENRTKGRV